MAGRVHGWRDLRGGVVQLGRQSDESRPGVEVWACSAACWCADAGPRHLGAVRCAGAGRRRERAAA
jgi:hypothetical protein